MKITRFSSIGSNQWNSDGQLRKTMDKDLRGWNQRPTQRCLQLLLKLSLLDKEEHIFRTLSMSLHCQSHWSFFFFYQSRVLPTLWNSQNWRIRTLEVLTLFPWIKMDGTFYGVCCMGFCFSVHHLMGGFSSYGSKLYQVPVLLRGTNDLHIFINCFCWRRSSQCDSLGCLSTASEPPILRLTAWKTFRKI